MKPTTFVITLIFALLIGWGLLKCNRQPEAATGAPILTASAPAVTETASTAPTTAATTAQCAKENNADKCTAPTGCCCKKKCCCCKKGRTERFEPNTGSAPDHRPLF